MLVPNPSRPPSRRPTIRTIAEAAGVSTATVSYVLSGRQGHSASTPGSRASGISPATTERVLAAAADLHYRPNRAARAIRTGKSDLVLLCLNLLSDPWSLAVCAETARQLADDGRTCVVLPDGDWYSVLRRQGADAVFIDDVEDTPQNRRRLRELSATGLQLVVLSDTIDPDGFDVVRSPALPGCRAAMTHLLQDHTDIGCLTTTSAYQASGPSRFGTYRDAIEAAGLPLREDRVAFSGFTAHSAFDAAMELLDRPDRPSALFAISDYIGLGAINAAHRLHLRIPEDIAIIGAGNTPEGEVAHPGLSTVGPEDAYGRIAALLRERAAETNRTADRDITLDWKLIVRASSDLATRDPAPSSTDRNPTATS